MNGVRFLDGKKDKVTPIGVIDVKTITILSVQEWGKCIPVPVQTLMRILLNNGYAVKLIG